MEKLTQDEQLAFIEALSKQIKKPLSDIKGDTKLDLQDAYRENGVDRRAIQINGEKVGEVSLSYNNPKPVINDMEKALPFLEELGLVEIHPITGWEKHFSQVGEHAVHSESGAIGEGMYWQGKTPKSASVRGCEPETVFPAIQKKLGGSLGGLLEGGFNE